jgi:hypothetical protein
LSRNNIRRMHIEFKWEQIEQEQHQEGAYGIFRWGLIEQDHIRRVHTEFRWGHIEQEPHQEDAHGIQMGTD